jgi:hypothetical protein
VNRTATEFPVELLDAAVELLGSAGKGGTVRVQGFSMMPLLRQGQVLAVDFSPERLCRGDLLVFRQVDYLVVHRLLGPAPGHLDPPRFRTRGDAVLGLDPHVTRDRILGRVTAIRDEAGWWGLRSGRARFYARMVAGHNLCWAAAGIVASRIDRGVKRIIRRKGPFRSWTAVLDRGLLRVAHALTFRLFHARCDLPAELERTIPTGDDPPSP